MVVGAVLGFAGTWIDARLRRRGTGRSAARLIWLELMTIRAAIRHTEATGSWSLEIPFRAPVWNAERTAFAEVADGLALASVALAYEELALNGPLVATTSKLAGRVASLQTAVQAPSDVQLSASAPQQLEASPPGLRAMLKNVESALTQLDRYNGLGGPVDYSRLTSRRDA